MKHLSVECVCVQLTSESRLTDWISVAGVHYCTSCKSPSERQRQRRGEGKRRRERDNKQKRKKCHQGKPLPDHHHHHHHRHRLLFFFCTFSFPDTRAALLLLLSLPSIYFLLYTLLFLVSVSPVLLQHSVDILCSVHLTFTAGHPNLIVSAVEALDSRVLSVWVTQWRHRHYMKALSPELLLFASQYTRHEGFVSDKERKKEEETDNLHEEVCDWLLRQQLPLELDMSHHSQADNDISCSGVVFFFCPLTLTLHDTSMRPRAQTM